MLLRIVRMLKKKLGAEAIEIDQYWCVLGNYFKIPSTLIIPEVCEKIGANAFQCCPGLKKVVIPENVEEIGRSAFICCQNATIILKKPEHEFKNIGQDAFWGCEDVKEETRN